MMRRDKVKKIMVQVIYTVKLVKDMVKDRKVYIYFRGDNIPEIDKSFALYVTGKHTDLIELHNLLKEMGKNDKLELKLIKSVYDK
jgi:hypothetical protein